MKIIIRKFWKWYQENIFTNQIVIATLFLWQVMHLYWLSTHVVADKLLGYPLFSPSELYQFLLIIADYFEIPALISGTIFYVYELNKGNFRRSVLFLVLINSQWLHLLWITDEFVLEKFKHEIETGLPLWLAWAAILIDYLELPVIYDATKRVAKSVFGNPLS